MIYSLYYPWASYAILPPLDYWRWFKHWYSNLRHPGVMRMYFHYNDSIGMPEGAD